MQVRVVGPVQLAILLSSLTMDLIPSLQSNCISQVNMQMGAQRRGRGVQGAGGAQPPGTIARGRGRLVCRGDGQQPRGAPTCPAPPASPANAPAGNLALQLSLTISALALALLYTPTTSTFDSPLLQVRRAGSSELWAPAGCAGRQAVARSGAALGTGGGTRD